MTPTGRMKSWRGLPEHLFVNEIDGSLHDTRMTDWAKTPVRLNYRRTFQNIENTAQLRATLRNGEFAWPGGYQMYFITSDGGALSFKTVREEYRNIAHSIKTNCNDGWRVIHCDINYEDNELYDDHTNEKIPAAYGGDDE